MRIKTQFIMTMCLFGIVLIGISASAVITNRQVEIAAAQESVAHGIALGANELSYLASDYVVYRENQQMERFESRFASFSNDVASLQADTPAEQDMVDKIQANAVRMKEVFDSVVSTVATFSQPEGATVDPEALQVSWSRMAIQNQGLISEATRLADLQRSQADQIQRTNLIVILAMIGVLVAFFGANYFLVQQRTLKSIAKLQAGVSIIGSGELDFKIEEKRNDEIGDLSNAFNRMTASLKGVTASKADLEREVAARKEVEEELLTINEELQEKTMELETEIDERKAAEARLESVAAQRQLALNAARLGWWHYDPVSKVSWWDERYKEIFQVEGYQKPTDEILARLHPEDLPGVWAKVEAALDPGNPKPYSAEYRIFWPDGSIRWIEAYGLAIFEGTGRSRLATSFVGTVADITERKQAQGEITYLASFPELNPDPILELDATGNINYANPEALRRFPDLTTEGHRHPFLLPLVNAIRQGGGKSVKHDVRIGGSWYEQVLTYVPTRDSYRVYVRDITERKDAEEALRKYAAELEDANRELESFSYSVSHDLRAPLRSMDGFSLALLEDYSSKLDDQAKKWLANIRNSSQRMGELIDDILGLSKVIRAELKVEQVDLSALAHEIADSLKRSESGRQVEFLIAPGAEASGDGNLLNLAMQNLLGNAYKFTSKSPSGRIEFGFVQQAEHKVFFVRDNGSGFDMRYVDRLFKPFHRLHSEKDYPGTGIGLATVQRIIYRHGGKVWAEGELDKGATFYFTLNNEPHDKI